jgi:hypothetical protein
MRGGISRNLPWRGGEGSFGAGNARRTGKGRGNRPEARAGRGTGKGFGPSRDPKRGSSKRLRPPQAAPGEWRGLRAEPRSERDLWRFRPREVPRKAAGFGPAFFERATGEASASMRALETARLRPGRIRRGRRGGISIPAKRPQGIGEGLHRPSARPTGCRTRPRGRAPGSEESEAGVRARLAIRKPPSERWPRHPATAVKAGTSGGRWRHRPPL